MAPTDVAAPKEQTKETAQEFLQVTSAAQLPYFEEQWRSWEIRSNNSKAQFGGVYKGDPCSTIYLISEDMTFRHFAGLPWEHFQRPTVSTAIFWSTIAKVEKRAQHVHLHYNNGTGAVRLTYPTEDLAARATFAMEFLRVACDPTADLAF